MSSVSETPGASNLTFVFPVCQVEVLATGLRVTLPAEKLSWRGVRSGAAVLSAPLPLEAKQVKVAFAAGPLERRDRGGYPTATRQQGVTVELTGRATFSRVVRPSECVLIVQGAVHDVTGLPASIDWRGLEQLEIFPQAAAQQGLGGGRAGFTDGPHIPYP